MAQIVYRSTKYSPAGTRNLHVQCIINGESFASQMKIGTVDIQNN